MDNLPAHKAHAVRDALDRAGLACRYLPARPGSVRGRGGNSASL
jgi:hypothetical protein